MTTNLTKLYHREVFFPKGKLDAIQGRTLKLKYSLHALQAAVSDRYGIVQIPKSIVFDEAGVFELELTGLHVTKFVVRLPYSATHDLALVIIPDGTDFFVKTVWLNDRNDSHRTLDRSKYAKS